MLGFHTNGSVRQHILTFGRACFFFGVILLFMVAGGIDSLGLSLRADWLMLVAAKSSLDKTLSSKIILAEDIKPYNSGVYMLFAERNPVAAEAHFRVALTQNWHAPLATFFLAESLRRQGVQAETVTLLRSLGEQIMAEFYARQTSKLLEQGSFALGEESARLSLAIEPQAPAGYSALCRLERGRRAYVAAITACRKAVEYSSESAGLADPLMWLGIVLSESGQQAEAITVFERALALGSQDPTLLKKLGDAYLAVGDLVNAERQWLAALDRQPTLLSAYIALGDFQMTQGQPELAQAWYERARMVSSGLPSVSHQMAGYYARLATKQAENGSFAQAESFVEMAFAMEAQSPEAYIALCRLRLAQKEFEAAVQACRRATELVSAPSQRAGHFFWLGVALSAAGQRADAIGAYQRALDLGSRDPSVHANLGNLLAANGDYLNAEREWFQALDIEPERISTWASLARMYRQTGCLSDAVRAYQRVVNLAGTEVKYVGLHVELAQLLESNGDLSGARHAWIEVLQMDPGNKEASAYFASHPK